ncbi:MAG: type II toxin-antitoxin system RelB/DinJ family antitoxin [Micrococcales bacterium]|nr:type II toxin-antitoxin system RelB/DinJ family antitoxin [Micrococcales bacterium]MCL2667498.1 type II toxin-antitoxin system RelB/DinJ family antitoxin [Micrococcales bacterium]
MSAVTQASINIRTDPSVKDSAQALFSALGMDMTTAINLFLRQAVRVQGIPFPVALGPARTARPVPGGWEDKIWIADDFDAPLDDFNDYQ